MRYPALSLRLLLALLLPLAAACASLSDVQNPSAAQRTIAARIVIFDGPANRPNAALGTVKGRGCRKKVFDTNIPEVDALQQLQLQAALLSADAVMNTVCGALSIDWFSDCFTLIECTGEAIRFVDRDNPATE